MHVTSDAGPWTRPRPPFRKRAWKQPLMLRTRPRREKASEYEWVGECNKRKHQSVRASEHVNTGGCRDSSLAC